MSSFTLNVSLANVVAANPGRSEAAIAFILGCAWTDLDLADLDAGEVGIVVDPEPRADTVSATGSVDRDDGSGDESERVAEEIVARFEVALAENLKTFRDDAVPSRAPGDAIVRHNFLADVGITFAEHTYSWFLVNDYKWYSPDTDVGTAQPITIDGKSANNVSGKVRCWDPEKGEGKWRPGSTPLSPALIQKGFDVLAAGAVKGLAESIRARLLGALAINDAGMVDVSDADIVVQAAIYGEIIYG